MILFWCHFMRGMRSTSFQDSREFETARGRALNLARWINLIYGKQQLALVRGDYKFSSKDGVQQGLLLCCASR
jgi:hypothetical protein